MKIFFNREAMHRNGEMKEKKVKIVAAMLAFFVTFTSITSLAYGLSIKVTSYWKNITTKTIGLTTTINWSKLSKKQRNRITGIAVFRNGHEVRRLKKTAKSFKDEGLKANITYAYQLKTYKTVVKKKKMWFNKATGKYQKKKPPKKYRGKRKVFKTKKYTYSNSSPIKKVMISSERTSIRDESKEKILNEEREKAKLITFIDDDGYKSFYEKMLPIIREKNISISTAIETGNVGMYDFMTWEMIEECHKEGAEILNHSKYHIYSKIDSSSRQSEDISSEMLDAIQDLSSHGYRETADIYVYPGASAGATWDEASHIMRIGINAGGDEVNRYPFKHRWTFRRYRMGSDHTPNFSEMKNAIDAVAHDGGWEIWMMHSHNGYMTDDYIKAFKQAIDYCELVDVKIVSTKEALDFYGIESQFVY